MFTGERIRLRKVEGKDAAIYHQWRNDTEVMKTTQPHLDVHTYESTEQFIKMITTSDTSKSYMIEEIETSEIVGITSMIGMDYKNRHAEVILDIGEKEKWGKGYGREALERLLDYSFLELNLHKVSLKVYAFNERAVRLYEHTGFTTEGRLKEELFRNGSWHDLLVMALFQTDYLKRS
ncbi:GNAT family N-acetyltransferase [Halobacillus kuroshimensis]|uniref:GNAT family N-acetyltransferase n=1 Tax=Halobacillus kuroshimensis TaxID=302481 RepID=UPI0003FE6FAE|nr:GNAT family protein [Halobacillus kuroshimensis]